MVRVDTFYRIFCFFWLDKEIEKYSLYDGRNSLHCIKFMLLANALHMTVLSSFTISQNGLSQRFSKEPRNRVETAKRIEFELKISLPLEYGFYRNLIHNRASVA